jgi:flagellar hook-associated protein 1
LAGGTFLGLNTAVQGLMAAQNAIDTSSHNIDNANTPGFSRERVNLVESPSLQVWGLSSQGPGQMGTGVQVGSITRLRNQFLDDQYRGQNQALGQAQVQQDTLNQITGIINEPSDTGVSNALQNFWNAWDTLQSNPNDLSARTEVQQSGVTLTQTLNQTASQLADLQTNVQSNLSSRVTQANSMVSQIANLSQEIQQQSSIPGVNPNALLDQRDALLDQLSQLGSVSVIQSGASYQVSLGGSVVVSNGQSATVGLSATNQVQATFYDSTTQSFDTTQPLTTITSPGGALQGTIDSMGYVQSYQNDLDTIAQSLAGANGQGSMQVTLPGSWSLVTASGSTPTFPVSGTFADGISFTAGDAVDLPQYASENITTTTSGGKMTATIPAGATVDVNGINGLEEIGYAQSGPGQTFFVTSPTGQPITALNITVTISPADIAAGTAAQPGTDQAMPGDGTLAGAISGVKNQSTSFANPANPSQTMNGTIAGYVKSVVSELGIQGQQANNMVTNEQALTQQIDTQRQSVSGVSLDEEMANVVQFQQAYNASAKMVDTINQMLQTLINSV